eukprot:PhM_4_TR13607/c0_g1_i1/m.60450
MDFCQGGDLDSYLNKFPNKRLEYDTARFYAAEILLALLYLHDNSCIYRDLKPENILLSSDGHAVLADFGLSKDFFVENAKESADPEDMRTASFVGSPFYVAPDVLKQKQYTLSIDFWSYGILVYRMLVGKVPFVGRNMKEVFDAIMCQELRFSSTIVLPPEAKDFISKLLIKDGSKRMTGKAVLEHPFFKGISFDAIYNKTSVSVVPQWTPLPSMEEVIASCGSSAAAAGGDLQSPQANHNNNNQNNKHFPTTTTTTTTSSSAHHPHNQNQHAVQAHEVVNTPITQQRLPGTQQKLFDGFSYCDNNSSAAAAVAASTSANNNNNNVLDT